MDYDLTHFEDQPLPGSNGITEAMYEAAMAGRGTDEPVTRGAAPAMKAAFTNSPLVEYTRYSPNNSGKRIYPITRITPHCVVGQCAIESLGALFANSGIEASSNYGIDKDGRVGLFVDEADRSWCSSSYDNDQRAVTIECASDTTEPYTMNQKVWDRLVELCADILTRNGRNTLLWLGSKEKALAYQPRDNEMVLTAHRWFANKSCPGEWLYSRFDELARKVTEKAGGMSAAEPVPDVKPAQPAEDGTIYRVQIGAYKTRSLAEALLEKAKRAGFENAFIVTVKAAGETPAFRPYDVQVTPAIGINVRREPGASASIVSALGQGARATVTEERDGWGRISGGWICLRYTERV